MESMFNAAEDAPYEDGAPDDYLMPTKTGSIGQEEEDDDEEILEEMFEDKGYEGFQSETRIISVMDELSKDKEWIKKVCAMAGPNVFENAFRYPDELPENRGPNLLTEEMVKKSSQSAEAQPRKPQSAR